MPAVTLNEYTLFADLPYTEADSKLTMFLNMAEEDYLEIQGKPWALDDAGNPVYPGSAKRIICEMTQFLLSGQVAEGSAINGYPLAVVSGIQRYVRVR